MYNQSVWSYTRFDCPYILEIACKFFFTRLCIEILLHGRIHKFMHKSVYECTLTRRTRTMIHDRRGSMKDDIAFREATVKTRARHWKKCCNYVDDAKN